VLQSGDTVSLSVADSNVKSGKQSYYQLRIQSKSGPATTMITGHPKSDMALVLAAIQQTTIVDP